MNIKLSLSDVGTVDEANSETKTCSHSTYV
jgi:hypothetical protein